MNVLAFDTTMLACSAAVLRTGHKEPQVFRRYERMERGHAEALFPMVREVMSEACLGFSGVDRIAVTAGPGTFTGVRIGVAAARALALAAEKPVVTATTLHVMAQQVIAHQALSGALSERLSKGFAVAADARRGQLYFQLFSSGGDPISDPQALSAGDAARILPHDLTLAVGSGAVRLAASVRELGRKLDVALGDLQPDAAHLAILAQGLRPSGASPVPLYLRPPDAKPQSGFAVEHLRR